MTARNIAPLTGLRCVAAVWVVAYHNRPLLKYAGALPGPANDVLSFGAAAVPLFWILSGFVMTHTYMSRIGSRATVASTARFYRLRIARVWPVHIATMLLTAAIGSYYIGSAGVPDRLRGAWPTLRNVLMINTWPFWEADASWNLVSWSMSMEWLAYLAFPVIVLILYRVRARIGSTLLAVSSIVPTATFVAYCLVARPIGRQPLVVTAELAVDFITGALLCLLCEKLAHRRVLAHPSIRRLMAFGPPTAIVLATVVLPRVTKAADVAFNVEVPYYIRGWLTPLFAVWILCLALRPDTRSLLSTKALIVGGQISYSLYMIQFAWAALWQLSIVAPKGGVRPAIYATGYLSSMVGAAYLMWRYLEEPARKLIGGSSPVGGSLVHPLVGDGVAARDRGGEHVRAGELANSG